MKHWLCGILLSFLAIPYAGAQQFYTTQEYGILVGSSQYFGDLNDNYGLRTPYPVAGVFFRLHVNPYIALRTSASYTRISYKDSYEDNAFNKRRNLSFRSHIAELAAQAEFNFFRFSTGELGSRFTPYLTAGVGVFYYNPTAEINGQQYNLRKLGTEGQNAGFSDRKYSNFGICFPIGAGVKYWLTPGINFGAEVANRLTLNDYVDDVSSTYVGAERFAAGSIAQRMQDRSGELDGRNSFGIAGQQRGNAASKDQYMYFMLTLSFQFKTYKCPSYENENYYFQP